MSFDLVKIFREMSGFQLLVVLALSAMAVASFTVVVERAWVLWRSRRAGRAFAPVAAACLADNDLRGLVERAAEAKGCHLAQLLGAGARAYLDAHRHQASGLPAAELARRELDRQRELIDAQLRRGFSVLASTGSVAPFVGLLGTVVGIIAAFEGISREGSGGIGAVSAGIAEALVVTAFGLLVAIPAVLVFNFLSTRADHLLLALDQAASQLVDRLEAGHHPVSDAARVAPPAPNGHRRIEGESLAEA